MFSVKTTTTQSLLNATFKKNNEPNTTNAKPFTTATIPYIKGTSETIGRILQPYKIRTCRSQTDYDFTETFN